MHKKSIVDNIIYLRGLKEKLEKKILVIDHLISTLIWMNKMGNQIRQRNKSLKGV